MGTMRYKPLDRVKIKSLDWYNENKDEYGYVRCIDSLFTPEHSKYCGCEFTISHITEFRIPSYIMEDNGHEWTDEMIEGLVEEPVLSAPNITEGVYIHEKDMKWTTEYILPDGYIFKDENGNVINATKIVLEKKKEYPKTYEECEKVLRYDSHRLDDMGVTVRGYKWELIRAFQILIICRDAYWKIAGEEMGLGKPWEPDWEDEHQEKYIIGSWLGTIQGLEENFVSHPFAFPTPEMRNAFKENFDPDIEICKELL